METAVYSELLVRLAAEDANFAMPLLSYRTGDTGILKLSPCGCGTTGPRIAGLAGKEISCFRLADVSAFSPTFFNDLFARFPSLLEFQITQHTVRAFRVVTEFSPEYAREQQSQNRRDIENYVRKSIPGLPEVEVEAAPLARNGKFRRYRSEV